MSDNVKKPAHYTAGGIETIDIIKSTLSNEQFQGFCIGNVLKYVIRYPHKNGIEDLEKASVYLDWSIKNVKKSRIKKWSRLLKNKSRVKTKRE